MSYWSYKMACVISEEAVFTSSLEYVGCGEHRMVASQVGGSRPDRSKVSMWVAEGVRLSLVDGQGHRQEKTESLI